MTLSSFSIQQNAYQGPFDVLCQLVESGELSVDKISVGEIVKRFLEFILAAEKIDLDAAADFLYLCADLIERKSKIILPPEEKIEIGEELVSEADLLNRLAQYRTFKDVAATLKERKALFEKVYARYGKLYEEAQVGSNRIVLKDVSLQSLVSAFKKLWDEVSTRGEIREIQSEEIRVEDRVAEIMEMLDRKSPLAFRDLFVRMTKLEIMVTFLAMLELIKAAAISARQGELFGEILIFRL
ncbi:MAG: segregation/condensation protein A [Candidatus Margulisiibacteriota bacterium]